MISILIWFPEDMSSMQNPSWGIFSLDLSKPINLNVHAEGNNLDEVLKVLAPYIID